MSRDSLPLIKNLDKNLLVPYYLMSSYLYYKEDKSVLLDSEFDLVCQRLLDEWDDIVHWHKELINKDDLSAGTGYAISEYPNRVKYAALSFYSKYGRNNIKAVTV